MMSLLVWNVRDLCSTHRQMKHRRILDEKHIDIFGMTKTKLKTDKHKLLQETLTDEWDFISNIDLNTVDNCDSIFIGWRKMNWSNTIIVSHKQILHCRLNNIGGYSFDLSIIYGEWDATKRRDLWACLTLL